MCTGVLCSMDITIWSNNFLWTAEQRDTGVTVRMTALLAYTQTLSLLYRSLAFRSPSPTLLLPLFFPSPPFHFFLPSSSSSPSHSPTLCFPSPSPCPLPPHLLVECLGADTKVVCLINQVIQPLSSSENSLDGIMLQVKGGTHWVKVEWVGGVEVVLRRGDGGER